MVLPSQEHVTAEAKLTQEDFLARVRAAGGNAVVGMPPEAIHPVRQAAPDVTDQPVSDADSARSANDIGDDVTPSWLGMAIETVARPDTAVIVARDILEVGRQFFYYYQAGDNVVERTIPPEGGQRLAVVGRSDDLVPRILDLMPVADTAETAATAQVELSDLLEAKRLAEDWQTQAAVTLLVSNGLEVDQAGSLVDAIQHPRFGGTITLLSVDGDEVDDARDIGVVQGDSAAWVMHQTTPGESMMTVRRTDGSGLARLLADDLSEV